ncbi:diguanylate cyclase [Chitinibacteraceae bacterium HSL-7]
MNWSPRQSTAISVFTLLFALGMVVLMGVQVASSYRYARDQAQTRLNHAAETEAQALDARLRQTTFVLHDLAHSLGFEPEPSERLADQQTWLEVVDALTWFDASGQVRASAGPTLDSSYLPEAGDRQHAQLSHRFTADNAIVLTQSMVNAEGKYQGAIIARIPASTLQRLLQQPGRDERIVFSLQTAAGKVLAVNRNSPQGEAAMLSAQQGIQTVPLVIQARQAQLTALESWRSMTVYYFIGGSLLLLMALVMAYAFWRSLRLGTRIAQKEARLNVSESRFRQMIETIPVGLILARQPEMLITYINRQGSRILDIPQAGALSLRPYSFYENPDDFAEELQAVHQAQGIRNIEVRLRRWNGEAFWGSVSMSAVEVGDERTLIIGFSDVSDRKQLELELKRRATTDGLSGLANRAHFMETANQELARAQRFKRPLSLIMLDIDHFKRINDTYGHDVGDEAIRAVARLAQGTLREIDLLARMGGEEFAALLPETTLDAAEAVAERIRIAIERFSHPLPDGELLRFTTSVGVSVIRTDDSMIDSLLKRADEALYRAKHGGRNRVCGPLAEDV